MTLQDLQIRERRPDELAAQVDVFNDAFPPDWHSSLEEMEGWEAMRRPEDPILRLLALAEGRPVGAGHSSRGTHDPEGRFEIDLAVRPRFQRQGIGRALYRRLEQFAVDGGATEIETGVRLTQLPAVERWLEEEGYRETSRMRESELDLTALPEDLEADARRRSEAAGVTLTTFGAEDTPDNRRKLWQLSVITERDIPFDRPHPDEPYERFEQMIENPLCLLDCLVVAREGDEYVGFSLLARRSPLQAMTWATGVHPSVRGRGVARALKTYSAALARRQGFTAMRTFNHVNNPAMLAVNVGMGYRPLPEVVLFLKQL